MTHGRHKPDILARTHAMQGFQCRHADVRTVSGGAHASITRATDPSIPRAASARTASAGKNDGVAMGTPPSLSAIGCVCGDSFSFEAAALAAASALTLPAGARTWTLGHRGSVGKQASEWVSIIGEGQVRLFQSDGIAPSTQPESLR